MAARIFKCGKCYAAFVQPSARDLHYREFPEHKPTGQVTPAGYVRVHKVAEPKPAKAVR